MHVDVDDKLHEQMLELLQRLKDQGDVRYASKKQFVNLAVARLIADETSVGKMKSSRLIPKEEL